jgi:hypothetical protein
MASIQYPQVKIPVENFDLISGASHMQSFHTSAEYENTNQLVAHTFCSRCGVHLLHATKSSNYLFLNALTLTRDVSAPEIEMETSDIDLYSNMRWFRKTYQESDAGTETKATSYSTSSDELDPLFIETSRPSAPILIHPSKVDENILRNQISITNISCSHEDHPFDSCSETRAMLHQRNNTRTAIMYRSPIDDDDADCVSLRSSPCRPTGTIISCKRRSLSNRAHYGVNSSFHEMDAQSVASSISDNFHSSYGIDSVSVQSRSTSLKSLRSSEDSHFQLRKYLAKHVTPHKSSASDSRVFFGKDVMEHSQMIDSPKLSDVMTDDVDSPTLPETLIDDVNSPKFSENFTDDIASPTLPELLIDDLSQMDLSDDHSIDMY